MARRKVRICLYNLVYKINDMARKERGEDEIWMLRKLMSRPNFAVLKLLMAKSPRTTRELYVVLGKSFTRKTLIITLRNLSMNLNVLQPTHIRTEHGYDLGYGINPKLKEVIKLIEKCEGMVRSASQSPKT